MSNRRILFGLVVIGAILLFASAASFMITHPHQWPPDIPGVLWVFGLTAWSFCLSFLVYSGGED